MKISYNWLKEYVSGIPEPAKVAEILTGCGLEVEGTETWFPMPGGLRGVVIGEVLTWKKHPDSDHLSLTTVNIGQAEPLRIVCGASNVAAGQKVAVATIGTSLFFNEKEIKIQKTKIRGEVSEGMICADDELGIGTSHAGIMVLDPAAVPGTPAQDYFQIEEDTIFEIGLTPNRSDATSHIGVARDLVAALNNTEGKETENTTVLKYPEYGNFNDSGKGRKIDIVIEDTEACPRYSGLTFTGITVKESPTWLKNRLNAIGLRPINNIVDITNFILMELGQPLHAFDADRIKGNKVIIQKYPEKKKFITLDEAERELTSQDLMICNAEEPMCIAGVFGGLNSGVTSNTTAVFLESAYFSPTGIRKTARHHGLQTDASFRFERGADINITVFALKRAAGLIREIAGGEVASGLVDVYPHPVKPAQVSLSFAHLDRLIGKKLEHDVVKNILSSLGITVLTDSESGLSLEIPSYKTDVTRECDVIEEILRIYGYNNIEFSTSIKSSISSSVKPDPEKIKNGISDYLCANGFTEIMNNSLTRSAYYSENPDYPVDHCVRILNPLSRDLDVMRQTMLYGGLESLAYNQNRKIADCKFFEFGNCYFLDAPSKKESALEKYREEEHMALFLTGRAQEENWNSPGRKVDIYDLKGFANSVIRRAGILPGTIAMTSASTGIYSQGMVYKTGNKTLGSLGVLSHSILKKFDLRQEVYYAEINWSLLLKQLKAEDLAVSELLKFPEVRRDIAMQLDRKVTYEEIEDLAFSTEKKLLKKVGLFDVYEGEKIETGKKSYALYFILQDEQKTLTDEEIDKAMQRLVRAFTGKLNALVR